MLKLALLVLILMCSGAQALLVGAGALTLGSQRAGAAAARAGPSGLFAVGARPSDSLLAAGSQPPSTLEVILTRRTVNDFEPALPDGWSGALERAVLAATHAPNHKRTEPWRFHLLGPLAVKRVCELNAELVAAKKGPEAGEKKLARWLAMPGWLVITQVVDGSSRIEEPAGVAREDYAACCCAVQNLCLSLHSEGITETWWPPTTK
jgi:hypothetical protein